MWLGQCSSPLLHPTELPANPHHHQGQWCSLGRTPHLPRQHPRRRAGPADPGLKVTVLHSGGSSESRIPLEC